MSIRKPPSAPDPLLLSVKDVAEALATSPKTVERLVAKGELRKVRIGGLARYRFRDVEALVERYAAQNDESSADDGASAQTGKPPRHGQD